MEKINSTTALKNAIQLLEVEQSIHRERLEVQLYLTIEGLKPINLLKSTFKDFTTSPSLIENILGTGVGLASGYLSKKIVIGASGNIIRKLVGSMVQFGVTNLVSQHQKAIISYGQLIFQKVFHKKEVNSESHDR